MQVFVDASLLTPTSAVGRVSGRIECVELPRVGEIVSLARAADPNAGFSGQLAVEHVLQSSSVNEGEPMLSLADIVAFTDGDGVSIGKALERCYGLFFEPYGE